MDLAGQAGCGRMRVDGRDGDGQTWSTPNRPWRYGSRRTRVRSPVNPTVVRKEHARPHAWALRMSPDGNIWGATINKTAGDAEKARRRGVPRYFPQGGGFPAQQRRQGLDGRDCPPSVAR